MAAGEKILERIEPTEDTKGNSGERGVMLMTNLRIIWFSEKSSRVNLSKSQYGCTQTTQSNLKL